MKRDHIYLAIDEERARQLAVWMDEPWKLHDMVKLAVLSEETGEVARAVLELDANNLKQELVQVAAVAVKWLESME